jgi:hypothetical protein
LGVLTATALLKPHPLRFARFRIFLADFRPLDRWNRQRADCLAPVWRHAHGPFIGTLRLMISAINPKRHPPFRPWELTLSAPLAATNAI